MIFIDNQFFKEKQKKMKIIRIITIGYINIYTNMDESDLITVLQSPDTNDCVSCKETPNEHYATFKLLSLEDIDANLSLVETMIEKLKDKGIKQVHVRFRNRGISHIKKSEEDDGTIVESVYYRSVCNVPSGTRCYEAEVHENKDRTFACSTKDFLDFYKLNMKFLADEQTINYGDIKKEDDDGFITITKNKKQRRDKKRFLQNKLAYMSKGNI